LYFTSVIWTAKGYNMPQKVCSGMFVTNIKSKKTLLRMRCAETY
jgi:hypothetical protein